MWGRCESEILREVRREVFNSLLGLFWPLLLIFSSLEKILVFFFAVTSKSQSSERVVGGKRQWLKEQRPLKIWGGVRV